MVLGVKIRSGRPQCYANRTKALEYNVLIYSSMEDVLINLFEQPLELDKEGEYVPHKLNVYYENRLAGKVHKVDVKKTIKDIVREKT